MARPKVFGEALGRYYSDYFDLSVLWRADREGNEG